MRSILITALACLAFVPYVVAQTADKPPGNATVICDPVNHVNCLTIGSHGRLAAIPYALPADWWRGSTTVLSGVNLVPNSQRDGYWTFISSIQCYREDADYNMAYHINLNSVSQASVAMPSPTKGAAGAFHDVTFSPPLQVDGQGGALSLSTSTVLPPANAATCNVQGYFAQ